MRLTVQDAARLLQVSEKTVYRWIKQGVLPVYRVNEQYRFNRAELLAWATSRRLNVSVDIFQESDLPQSPLPTLAEALGAGGIFYRLDGDDRESALRSLTEHMRLPDEVDRDYLLRLFLAREALGSTAAGQGIALPQLLYPTTLELSRPVATLGFLEHPVDWEALDGQPVQILLATVCPTVRAHLHLQTRLSFALRNPAVLSVLQGQGRREEILEQLRAFEESLQARARI
jgi:PTS system nitrogen regulatory IIA component